MISNLVSLPYRLARLPVELLDHTVSDMLPEDSGLRLTLDRTIGSADKLAGTLLRDPDIAKRGADRVERAVQLRTASRLEAEAAADRDEARETAVEGRREADEKRKAAQERVASGLDQAETTEARGKEQAKVKAAKTASAQKAAADKRAANRTATAEERKARVGSQAEAKKQAAQRAADAEMEEARETWEAAAEARTDAERLSDLTETKKQQPKKD